jgi:hypothetical protein
MKVWKAPDFGETVEKRQEATGSDRKRQEVIGNDRKR